jgi:6-phosphogluconate dehydrogenase-like protein
MGLPSSMVSGWPAWRPESGELDSAFSRAFRPARPAGGTARAATAGRTYLLVLALGGRTGLRGFIDLHAQIGPRRPLRSPWRSGRNARGEARRHRERPDRLPRAATRCAMKKIGVIGLGEMGLPMARNLIARGLEVKGFDIRAHAGQAFQAAGGRIAGSAADAAPDQDAVVIMVRTADQAEQVVLGQGGVLRLLQSWPPSSRGHRRSRGAPQRPAREVLPC